VDLPCFGGENKIDRLLKSRYKIKDKIGEGPFSVTYRGSYLEGETSLIVKIYKRSALNSSLIKTIKKKVKVLCNISHKNIANVIDGDYGWQGFYFVREFIKGRTLSELMAEESKFEVPKALEIAEGICEALQAVHGKGIIHGALNPNNVIISDGDIVKLTDFVIMGEMRGSINERAQMAYRRSSFLAPEEVRGEVSGPQADIYSVGFLLYLILAGKHPFQGSSGIETSLNILSNTLAPLSDLRRDVPSYLSDVVSKALEKDPLMRFQTVGALLSSLRSKTLVEERRGSDEFSSISLEGMINSADDEFVEEEEEEKEGSRPNLILVVIVIASAAAVGVGYAVMTALMGR
jgi:serine/threonine-protein kinase